MLSALSFILPCSVLLKRLILSQPPLVFNPVWIWMPMWKRVLLTPRFYLPPSFPTSNWHAMVKSQRVVSALRIHWIRIWILTVLPSPASDLLCPATPCPVISCSTLSCFASPYSKFCLALSCPLPCFFFHCVSSWAVLFLYPPFPNIAMSCSVLTFSLTCPYISFALRPMACSVCLPLDLSLFPDLFYLLYPVLLSLCPQVHHLHTE